VFAKNTKYQASVTTSFLIVDVTHGLYDVLIGQQQFHKHAMYVDPLLKSLVYRPRWQTHADAVTLHMLPIRSGPDWGLDQLKDAVTKLAQVTVMVSSVSIVCDDSPNAQASGDLTEKGDVNWLELVPDVVQLSWDSLSSTVQHELCHTMIQQHNDNSITTNIDLATRHVHVTDLNLWCASDLVVTELLHMPWPTLHRTGAISGTVVFTLTTKEEGGWFPDFSELNSAATIGPFRALRDVLTQLGAKKYVHTVVWRVFYPNRVVQCTQHNGVTTRSLLMLSGDVESNPGPYVAGSRKRAYFDLFDDRLPMSTFVDTVSEVVMEHAVCHQSEPVLDQLVGDWLTGIMGRKPEQGWAWQCYYQVTPELPWYRGVAWVAPCFAENYYSVKLLPIRLTYQYWTTDHWYFPELTVDHYTDLWLMRPAYVHKSDLAPVVMVGNEDDGYNVRVAFMPFTGPVDVTRKVDEYGCEVFHFPVPNTNYEAICKWVARRFRRQSVFDDLASTFMVSLGREGYRAELLKCCGDVESNPGPSDPPYKTKSGRSVSTCMNVFLCLWLGMLSFPTLVIRHVRFVSLCWIVMMSCFASTSAAIMSPRLQQGLARVLAPVGHVSHLPASLHEYSLPVRYRYLSAMATVDEFTPVGELGGDDESFLAEFDRDPDGLWLYGKYPGTDLSRLAKVVTANKQAFAYSMNELPGYSGKMGPVNLKLNHDKPIYQHERRHSAKEKEVQDKKCGELKEGGVISRVHQTLYASNTTLPPKKDADGNWTEYRFCVDFRPLNDATPVHNYPLPLPEDLFREVAKCRYFSKLDLRAGFHQIPLDAESISKTAFWWNGELWAFNRLPFGLKNATAFFQE